MPLYRITTREEYDYAVSRGYEPLIDGRFDLDHALRVVIQREKFGTGHSPEENERFYRFVWEHRTKICEECLRPLHQYSATFVSHILTRGANPELAHDPRNTNILCFAHHNQWEHATTRMGMRIYLSNQRKIEELRKEYYNNEQSISQR